MPAATHSSSPFKSAQSSRPLGSSSRLNAGSVTGISLDPFNPQKVDHQLANIGQPRLSAIQKTPTIDRVDIELSYISDIADASKGKLLIHVKGLSGAGLTNVESWLSIAAKSSVKDRRALLLAFAAVQPNYVRLALLCCIWSNLVEAVSDLEGPTVAMAAGLSTVQHPDAGLLDSYVTNAGGNTGDLFDELTNLPDLEARSVAFEAGLLRFTQANPVALPALIDVSAAEGSTGRMQAADKNFEALLNRMNTLEQALTSKVSSNELQSYVSTQIDDFTQNVNTGRVCLNPTKLSITDINAIRSTVPDTNNLVIFGPARAEPGLMRVNVFDNAKPAASIIDYMFYRFKHLDPAIKLQWQNRKILFAPPFVLLAPVVDSLSRAKATRLMPALLASDDKLQTAQDAALMKVRPTLKALEKTGSAWALNSDILDNVRTFDLSHITEADVAKLLTTIENVCVRQSEHLMELNETLSDQAHATAMEVTRLQGMRDDNLMKFKSGSQFASLADPSLYQKDGSWDHGAASHAHFGGLTIDEAAKQHAAAEAALQRINPTARTADAESASTKTTKTKYSKAERQAYQEKKKKEAKKKANQTEKAAANKKRKLENADAGTDANANTDDTGGRGGRGRGKGRGGGRGKGRGGAGRGGRDAGNGTGAQTDPSQTSAETQDESQ
jgi:hypothetical protein